jgi:hypothetical protein
VSAERTDRKIKIGVQASCGHSWVETRPAGTVAPVNGETRVCGHPECYPAKVTVAYSEPIEVD